MKYSVKFFIVLLISVVAIIGFVLYYQIKPQNTYTLKDAPIGANDNWPDLAQRFERDKLLVAEIFSHSQKVETFRITTKDADLAKQEDLLAAKRIKKNVGGFPVVSVGPILKKDFSNRLAKMLLDPKSYLAPGEDQKSCILTPNVAFRVWKENQHVDVVICFSCSQLVVIEENPQLPLRSIGAYRFHFRVGGDFDPVRRQMINLCKQVFKRDQDLQALLSD